MNRRIILLLRKLAKSSYYQTLFSFWKEGSNLRLFCNDMDLSYIQLLFLKYLNFYGSLYLDVAMGDIDDKIFENEIYEDSYVMYRNKKETKDTMKHNKKNEDFVKTTHWIFRDPKKT